MSRPNTIVVPGGKIEHAMELLLNPVVKTMMEKDGNCSEVIGIPTAFPAISVLGQETVHFPGFQSSPRATDHYFHRRGHLEL